MPYTPVIRSRNAVVVLIGVFLKSGQLVDHNFPHDNQYQDVCNPVLAFHHQGKALLNQMGPVVREASLLVSVM